MIRLRFSMFPRRAALAAATTVLLAACQTTPPPGRELTAQVLSLPAQRSSLGGGYRELHPALRAGVTRAEVEAGRLVRGRCVEPDAAGERAAFAVTTLLPPGTVPAPMMDVRTAAGVRPDAVGARTLQQHGQYLAPVAMPAPDEPPRCRAAGGAEGVMRIEVTRRIEAWEHDFAAAELARHDQFVEADFAARAVVELGCRVEALGDRAFMQVRWFARLPAGMTLGAGDTVRLVAGAAEDSKEAAPLARILGPAARPAGLDASTRVPCG